MTIRRSLAQWLEDNGFGTYGTNLFIGGAPLDAPTPTWWILGGGGTSSIKTQTGERIKDYVFTVFYRNTDAEDVDNQLQLLEEEINSKDCHELQDYETVELEASGFESDSDLDGQDRTIGSIEITARVYQS